MMAHMNGKHIPMLAATLRSALLVPQQLKCVPCSRMPCSHA